MPLSEQEKSDFHFITALLPKHQLSRLQKAMGALGIGMGVAVVYAEFTLGAGFGDFVADKLSANAKASVFLHYFFGLSAMIPTAALVAVPTQNKLMALFEWPQKEKKVRQNNHPLWYKSVNVLGYFSIALTGAPFAYILVQTAEGHLPLQIFWVALAIITSSLCVTDSILSSIDIFFNRYARAKEEIDELHIALFAKLNAMMSSLYCITDQEVKELFSLLSAPHPDVFLKQLQTLSVNLTHESTTVVQGWGKKALDALAILTVGIKCYRFAR